MSTQLNNSGFETGSNYNFSDKMIKPNFPRSLFDESHLVTRDIPQAGLVVPLSLLEVLPASDYELSISWLVRVLPQVVPLMSRQRIYFYAFYSRCADLWNDFDVFIRKGYSGNVVKTIPVLNSKNIVDLDSESPDVPTNPEWSNSTGVLPHSLGDFFGLPLGSLKASPVGYNINALPFMMYARIWRDYFLNRNYYYEDSRILPDDDSRFRLNDDGEIMSFKDAGDGSRVIFDFDGAFSTGVSSSPVSRVSSKGMTYIDDDSKVFCISPFYHDYPADYFVSALPWPQRGNTPELISPLTGTASGVLNWNFDTDVDLTSLVGTVSKLPSGPVYSYLYNSSGSYTGSAGNTHNVYTGQLYADGHPSGSFVDDTNLSKASAIVDKHYATWLSNSLKNAAFNKTTVDSSVSGVSASITLEALRELSISQTIMEKMARTDGSYYEFGLTFFGEPSKAATDYRPTFIGGCTGQMIFSEVLQTSQSSQSSALGQYAGHGISGNSGFLGRFHADDYGYIMVCACIMPDVYYSQGLNKLWTRIDQASWFLPERALLGMQPILNKELYFQDNSVVDDDDNPVNNNLWAYQDIYDELRYHNNIIGGQIAQSDKLSFFPFTQSRLFDSLPNWGREFARSDDVRNDYLYAPVESPYICQFDIGVRSVKPLPYRAQPGSLLNGIA